MSILRTAQAIVSLTARRVSGDPVTYRRGELSFAVPFATQGKTRWQLRDTQGMLVVTESVDWLIEFDALDVEPAKFDRIELDLPANRNQGIDIPRSPVIYQVMPFGPEGRCWRWHGADRNTARIFTTLLSDPGVTA